MSKQTSATRLSRPVTLAEAEAALIRLASVTQHLAGQPDDDDPVAVLRDVVAEWQELRALKEKVAQQQNELKVLLLRK